MNNQNIVSVSDLRKTYGEKNERQYELLVTHDPFSASFCQRILFIKDGVIGQELRRNGTSRSEFYQEILEKLGTFEQ